MRCVIVLDPTLKIDEVDIPYKAFIEQFKGKIVKYIIEDKGWSITKATNYVSSKFMFDEYVYDIMCRIVDDEAPRIILNRNPTITFGSILSMGIRQVKRDPTDVTLSIPSAILPGLQVYAQALSPGLTNTYLIFFYIEERMRESRNIHLYQVSLVTELMARGNISRYGKN